MKRKNINKKSILIVSNCTWYLYNFREELLKELNQNDYRLILLSPFDKYYLKISKYFENKEKLFLLRGSENPLLEIITILHMFFIYLKYKPELVHHFTIKPCIYGGIISRFLSIKNTINHITGLGPSFFSNRLKINFINILLKPLYKYAFTNNKNNLINIFHNDDDRISFLNKGITSNRQTITIKGSGVNSKYYKNRIPRNQNKTKQILFPARILKEKGIIELVNSCKNLWNEDYKFHLNIAGEIDKHNQSHIKGKTLDYILNNQNISFLGKCNNMKDIYMNIDIVVLPSWREGLSKSLLEAASMSLPIITTNVPGCKEIVKNEYSGTLVPVRNEVKLKNAIQRLLDNPEIAYRLGKNARKTIIENFTVELINNKILEIYKEFLQ